MNNTVNNREYSRKEMKKDTLLVASDISKSYMQGEKKVDVFNHVSLTIKRGELLALVGPSGSGKTSLLNIIGLLDVATSGTLEYNGYGEVNKLSDHDFTKIRGKKIGFVFQFHHLLPDFTALENIIIAQLIQGIQQDQAKIVGIDILTKMGLKSRLDHFPSMLSGGEQQRVAIARAICCNPELVIADEPTGNLDSKTAQGVFNILLELVNQFGISIIIATHSKEIFSRIDKKLEFKDGVLFTS